MKQGRTSVSAAWVAIWRGGGAWLPKGAEICSDPWAHAFVMPLVKPLIRLADTHPSTAGNLVLKTRLRRIAVWILVRTRVIDDVMLAFVKDGGSQIINLGAGFDTRAARFRNVLDDCRIFEIDHPCTQERKVAIMHKYGIETNRVSYIPWNFEAQSVSALPERLITEGFDRTVPALVIWEGVVQYLSETAVDATVRSLGKCICPGSQLIVNYSHPRHAQNPRMSFRMAKLFGEPVRFCGWLPHELPDWFDQRGFDLLWDKDDREMAGELLPSPLAEYFIHSSGRIALARYHD